ncbi:MAG: response regulator [Clostridiales Family XIII bacterium]|jgi:putative two-component system response regulator|nr:response regulator [Clostridiales Family XIII bacterium]
MGTERRNILIVDDIDINRAILFELFHEQYNVLEAENGQVALDLIEEYGTSIAVVLLDVVMPVLDGFAVLGRLSADDVIDKIPIIMITAENDEAMALKGYSMGVIDIINKPFNPDIVRRRVQNTVDLFMHKFYLEDMVQRQMDALETQNAKLKMANNFIIDALSTAVEFRNQESGRHIRRMRALTKLLLENLSAKNKKYFTPPEKIETIANASAMHDIGKIAISDAILLKPGRFTPEEFEIMKTHTVKGCEILQSINFTGDLEYYRYCYDICRNHHERWDGRGYPDRLSEDEIPLCAQVVSIVDVYDALTSDRVYKPTYSHEQAMAMIRGGECGLFNPDLMACFIETAPEFLDEDKLRKYAEPSFPASPATSFSISSDEIPSSRALEMFRNERAKFQTLVDISDEIAFEYEIPSDTVWFSRKASELLGLGREIAGFRRVLGNSRLLSKQDKDIVFNVVMKMNRQTPKEVFQVDVMTATGDLETFRVTMGTVFDNDSADKISYVGYLNKA